MATKTFKIGLSNTDKQNMAQDIYERLINMSFDEYDSSNTYNKGDFVVYEDPEDTFNLYECNSDNVTGAWDSTKWDLATFQTLVDNIEDAVAFVNDKANVDGNYPTMTVGVADQLSPYDDESGDDQDEPFSFQATGTGNGTQPDFATGSIALMKEKQGNTVVVNQKFAPTNEIIAKTGVTRISDWELTFSNTTIAIYDAVSSTQVVNGHKYFIYIDFKAGTGNDVNFYWYEGGNLETVGPDSGHRYSCFTASADGNLNLRGYTTGTCTGDLKYVLIDLTQWFGSNDNIPADLLSHPENFFRYYQGDLSYNTGELVNANGRYIKCIGRNQMNGANAIKGKLLNTDGSVGDSANSCYIKFKVIPNTSYAIFDSHSSKQSIMPCFYDKDGNFISRLGNGQINNVFEMKLPANCCEVGITCWADKDYLDSDITISLYYEGESGYDQYYPYEVLTNNDTGTETLRSAGSVRDYKEPNGTIHRLVGTRAYQSGDENDNSVITDGTNTNYELAEPTTEQGTPYSENIVIDDFGSMDFSGTSGVPQGNLIFYPVDYKAFIDTLYDYTEGTPSNIALKSDLSADKSELQGVDTQLLNAIGGTLRHCLAIQESGLNFEDTDFVDLGSLNWTAEAITNCYSASITGMKDATSSRQGVLCTKYPFSSVDELNNNMSDKSMLLYANSKALFIKDSSYANATAFKNAMKGVLLAYEKASS